MVEDANKRLSAAQEDYIRSISKLAEAGGTITISALAGKMKVRSPSVSVMVQRLEKEGLVFHPSRSELRLTSRGQEIALNIHRRHRLIETFLVNVLGFDWSEVHEDAEILEHHLSDRLVRAIDRYLGHPQVDPHGHPIPSPEGKVITRNLVPLESLVVGGRATIREVSSDDPERIRRWKELGLVPGAEVRVVERQPLDGTWLLDVAGTPVMTGHQGVTGLFVERNEPARKSEDTSGPDDDV